VVEFTFTTRLGRSTGLTAWPGEFVAHVLERNHIPSASVLVTRDGLPVPVPDSHTLVTGSIYLASLIEGYDIDAMRRLYQVDDAPAEAAYVKRRLSFDVRGRLRMEQTPLALPDVVRLVEDTVRDTVSEHRLIPRGGRVVIGLSGGVDSSALLIALASLRAERSDFDIVAVTFEDYGPAAGLGHAGGRRGPDL
jgi:hypothetical protein